MQTPVCQIPSIYFPKNAGENTLAIPPDKSYKLITTFYLSSISYFIV